MKDVGSGITLSVPLEESVHPSGAATLENQLLAVPPARSISWNVSVRSGAKLSKVICAVPASVTVPSKTSRSNWLGSVPVISNVVVSVVDTDVEVKVVSAADVVKTVINSFLTLRIDLIYYIWYFTNHG